MPVDVQKEMAGTAVCSRQTTSTAEGAGRTDLGVS